MLTQGRACASGSLPKKRGKFFFELSGTIDKSDCSGSSDSLSDTVHCRPYHLPTVLTQRGHQVTGSSKDAGWCWGAGGGHPGQRHLRVTRTQPRASSKGGGGMVHERGFGLVRCPVLPL